MNQTNNNNHRHHHSSSSESFLHFAPCASSSLAPDYFPPNLSLASGLSVFTSSSNEKEKVHEARK
jgi:hypothetical protein